MRAFEPLSFIRSMPLHNKVAVGWVFYERHRCGPTPWVGFCLALCGFVIGLANELVGRFERGWMWVGQWVTRVMHWRVYNWLMGGHNLFSLPDAFFHWPNTRACKHCFPSWLRRLRIHLSSYGYTLSYQGNNVQGSLLWRIGESSNMYCPDALGNWRPMSEIGWWALVRLGFVQNGGGLNNQWLLHSKRPKNVQESVTTQRQTTVPGVKLRPTISPRIPRDDMLYCVYPS